MKHAIQLFERTLMQILAVAKLVSPLFCALLTTDAAAKDVIQVHSDQEMRKLLTQADTDRDQKITVLDRNTTFWLKDTTGASFEVSGAAHLSNLLQELKLSADAGGKKPILGSRVFENPVARVSRSIRELYWDGLTRRIDETNLQQVLTDDKLPAAEFRHLYVSANDAQAFEYFSKISIAHPEWRFKVWQLPAKLYDESLRDVSTRHGVLALALEKSRDGKIQGVPFVVPGGRFNEMYGWDSYFETLGLLQDDRVDLARAMVDNFVYEIENYGKILNANRSYYLTRSQPPFLTSMISEVYARLPRNADTRNWLDRALKAAIREHNEVWMNPDRLTSTGLSRYYGNGKGIPPEVEPGHFDHVLKPAAERLGMTVSELTSRYNAGSVNDPALDDFFSQDRAVRESGHDTTYRWRVDGVDRAADFVTVDLNSLLLKFELDLARLLKGEFSGRLAGTTDAQWTERANRRKRTMIQLMWDRERKIFFDYDFRRSRRSSYISATAFYPFWVDARIVPDGRASIRALLKELEAPGGLSSTAESSLKRFGDPAHQRQWEFPNGWAPHQMIAWRAMRAVGDTASADRLTYKWLYTIAKNAADFNGTIPEKTDVVKRSHAVFAEYGNVGTQFSYITREGFGWMNASFQVGLATLSPELRGELGGLKPPDWLPTGTPNF